ncbi:hypothetical protein PsYK624_086870 [Phanerochaete sordida]|uniref:Uncharacterized protein n=1 Tax=Phanerochaete sordida TaxID=48140 RepID=A0A9P3LFD9_9APHY|nr:hypothetical protein PsYK624_086870 [Phanerochaete sordida]
MFLPQRIDASDALPRTPVKIVESKLSEIQDYDDENVPDQEVWLAQGRNLHIENHDVNGKATGYAKLTEILPSALKSSSPMKKAHGRVYRAGIAGFVARIDLSTVQDFVSGRVDPSPRLKELNMCALKPVEEDDEIVVCEVFLNADTDSAAHDLADISTPDHQDIAKLLYIVAMF